MIRYLILTLITLLGFNKTNTPKYDLHKRATKEETHQNLVKWFYLNRDYILVISVIFALVVFVVVCFSIGSGTESGMIYNRFDKVI